MLLDPSGRPLQMEAVLPALPVVMGQGPIGLAYGLLIIILALTSGVRLFMVHPG
jgi:hypothetical protein